MASLVNQDLEQTETLTGVTGEDVEVQLTAPVEIEPGEPGQPRPTPVRSA